MRMIRRNGHNGSIIIDDSYNANPEAMRAAMRLLVNEIGEKILVFGYMVELGKMTEEYHRNIGLEAKALGINKLYAIGDLTRFTVEAFGQGAQHFVDRDELINAVRGCLKPGVAVLVKGSKVNHLWEVVEKLCC